MQNLRNFFACRRIKHGVIQKKTFCIKDPNIKVIRFGANIICTCSFISRAIISYKAAQMIF